MGPFARFLVRSPDTHRRRSIRLDRFGRSARLSRWCGECKAELQTGLAESVRAIAMAVIGEQPTNANTQSGAIGHGGAQKSNRRSAGEVGQDLGERDPRMIVDGHIQILPASMMFPAPSPVGAGGDFR